MTIGQLISSISLPSWSIDINAESVTVQRFIYISINTKVKRVWMRPDYRAAHQSHGQV